MRRYYVYVYISGSTYVLELKWNRLLLFIENFHIRFSTNAMPRFKKVIEVQFPRMFAPEWIGRIEHLPRVSKYAIVSEGGGGGGEKVPPLSWN